MEVGERGGFSTIAHEVHTHRHIYIYISNRCLDKHIREKIIIKNPEMLLPEFSLREIFTPIIGVYIYIYIYIHILNGIS
jgi:hypothetical protein